MDIQITHLIKVYKGRVRALDDMTLSIPTGMFGLLGANGAGKTTLMRILAGVIRPTAGEVKVGSHNMASRTGRLAVKRTLGYLPQELGLYPDLSAREFLDYLALLKGIDDTPTRRRQIDEVLGTVALTDVGNRKLRTYSGGMRRRVGIAQALLGNPRLLIVDEPTAGLDPEERIRFRTLLSQLAGDRTIVLSTHIVEDIAQTCRDLAVIARGRVVFTGTVAALASQARGKVWTLSTAGATPPGGTVVSAVSYGATMEYRLVSSLPPDRAAQPAEPTLEDGYVALAQTQL